MADEKTLDEKDIPNPPYAHGLLRKAWKDGCRAGRLDNTKSYDEGCRNGIAEAVSAIENL